MSFEFLQVVVPSCLSIGMFFIQQSVNIYVAGHLNDASVLAAIGMGNLIQNCLFTAPIVGVNSAFETLACKTAGAENYELIGIYLNRGKVVVTVVVIFQCFLCLWTKDLLLFLK